MIDSGDAVARQVARVLEMRGLRRLSGGPGRVTYLTSSPDLDQLRPVLRRLSGEPALRLCFVPVTAR